MPAPPPRLPLRGVQAGFRRFTVAEYHKLIQCGVLTEDDDLELIDGYLVHKMSRNPPHDYSILALNKRLLRLVPAGWEVRVQSALTLTASEPEPDFAVVRGTEADYRARHPAAADVGLVIEVADSSLDSDRADKLWIYAEAGVPVYWIVNLVDRRAEVYERPSGSGAAPGYGTRTDYPVGSTVPVTLGGAAVGAIPVGDLIP